MGLLDWDHAEIAQRLQTGLDRLSVSFLRGHGARIRRDALDFHGYEHVELELSHAGHTLQVRQYGPAAGQEPSAAPTAPEPEFVSLFDGRPTAEARPGVLAAWLASLPAGEAPPERPSAPAAPDNPFAPGARQNAAPRGSNPFQPTRVQPTGENPFAPPPAEERRQRARRWLEDES